MPRQVPAPPGRLNELPAFAAEGPDPLRRAPEQRSQFGDPSAQGAKAPGGLTAPGKQGQAGGSPYAADRPRPAPRPYTPEQPPAEGGSKIARSVLGWLFAIAALAALAYLANTVFTRPDPRKARQQSDGVPVQAPGP